MTDLTRQAPPSLGNPRLIFAMGGVMHDQAVQREFELVDHVTTIGSAAGADLCLEGLEAVHAEIRHDQADDYTYFALCALAAGTVHGRQGGQTVLRTGTRITLGQWTVSFFREEYADNHAPMDSEPGREFASMRADANLAEQVRSKAEADAGRIAAARIGVAGVGSDPGDVSRGRRLLVRVRAFSSRHVPKSP